MFDCICTDDHDGPSVSSAKTVKARKQHECCECHEAIEPGEVYELYKGCWDGRWDNFKTCRICSRIRSDLMSCGFIFGELWESLREAYRGDEEWLR